MRLYKLWIAGTFILLASTLAQAKIVFTPTAMVTVKSM